MRARSLNLPVQRQLHNLQDEVCPSRNMRAYCPCLSLRMSQPGPTVSPSHPVAGSSVRGSYGWLYFSTPLAVISNFRAGSSTVIFFIISAIPLHLIAHLKVVQLCPELPQQRAESRLRDELLTLTDTLLPLRDRIAPEALAADIKSDAYHRLPLFVSGDRSPLTGGPSCPGVYH